MHRTIGAGLLINSEYLNWLKSKQIVFIWNKIGQNGTPASTYSNLVLLDSAIAQAIKNGLIPIIELHDQTCQNFPSALINLANWFVQPAVIQIINRYKHSIILNIANEAIHVNWTSNPGLAKTTFQNTYSTIVNTLRSAGISVPIMIDGP
jgi:mannan endo-1,4-beta-mannosidase